MFVVILTSLLLASLSIDISFVCVVFLLQANAWGGASGVQRGGDGGGPVKMIFDSTADSLYSVLYV